MATFKTLPTTLRAELASLATLRPQAATQIPEPPLARFLFADTRMALVWLIIRLYLGYEWPRQKWETFLARVNTAASLLPRSLPIWPR